ncbi:MAG: NADAR family protein [Betaproteobacteria bacterium]
MTSRHDLETLRALARTGKLPPLLCFWGHRQRADGQVSSSCFSQWYPSPFEVDGVACASAEHFMMAEKARLFGDRDTLQSILAAATPNDAKSLGRRVQGYDDRRWEAARFDIVVRGNFAKFSANGKLRRFLLATSPQVLVEASPVDAIWGIGLAADDPRAMDPLQWQGLNLLGFALMLVRDRLGED